jgi:hypothetical protein
MAPKPSLLERLWFTSAKQLFQLRRKPGRLNFNEGYPASEHKELIKIEDPKNIFPKDQKYQLLNTETGKLEDAPPNHQLQKGDICVIKIPTEQQNSRSTTTTGKADNTNLRIRFIEHIPPQIEGHTNIQGAILNTHGINSNLSISSERTKHAAILRHNAANPKNQQMFISYDPPGYGLSGEAKIAMTQNKGHKLEELTIGSMSLMAHYTSAKAKEASANQDIGLSIHTHSMSTGVATSLVSDVFEGKEKSYCGVKVPSKESLNLTSLSIDSPYTSFQEVVTDSSKGIIPKAAYNKLGLPDLDNVTKMENLAQNAPKGFKIDIEQPRAKGGELSALVGSGDGIMKHKYAEKIAAAAVRGINKNPNYTNTDKEGAVTLCLINEATHHGKTAQRFGTTSEITVGEKIKTHSKVKSFINSLTGKSRTSNISPVKLHDTLQTNTDYKKLKDDFDKASRSEQEHKYTSASQQRLNRLFSPDDTQNKHEGVKQDNTKVLNVISHESTMLRQALTDRVEHPENYSAITAMRANIKKYDDIASKVSAKVDKRVQGR